MEYADRILINSTRLSSLTGNILLLSWLDHQQIEMGREWFSLDEQIRETLLMFEPQWSAKHIELEVDLDSMDYVGNAVNSRGRTGASTCCCTPPTATHGCQSSTTARAWTPRQPAISTTVSIRRIPRVRRPATGWDSP